MEFLEFPKMARLSRECLITEKIDGTNAQIFIFPESDIDYYPNGHLIADQFIIAQKDNGFRMIAGSRNRYITPENDNYGFAGWVQRNSDALFDLGPGRHFGEWWGNGIQRKYGMTEKRFSLFNAHRWANPDTTERPPECCSVVPVLYRGIFSGMAVEGCLNTLQTTGSYAAPGFMDPEGIVIYHTAAQIGFKKTLKNDESPKSMVKK